MAALGARLFIEAYGPTHPEPTLGKYVAESFSSERFERVLQDPRATILVVEGAPGEFLGYAELQLGAPDSPDHFLTQPLPGAHPLEIVRFYVDERWHGRGLAAALMTACEAEARARGADVLWLQAWQEAARAVAFYVKVGFRRIGTAVFYFGSRRDSDYLLARAVSAAD